MTAIVSSLKDLDELLATASSSNPEVGTPRPLSARSPRSRPLPASWKSAEEWINLQSSMHRWGKLDFYPLNIIQLDQTLAEYLNFNGSKGSCKPFKIEEESAARPRGRSGTRSRAAAHKTILQAQSIVRNRKSTLRALQEVSSIPPPSPRTLSAVDRSAEFAWQTVQRSLGQDSIGDRDYVAFSEAAFTMLEIAARRYPEKAESLISIAEIVDTFLQLAETDNALMSESSRRVRVEATLVQVFDRVAQSLNRVDSGADLCSAISVPLHRIARGLVPWDANGLAEARSEVQRLLEQLLNKLTASTHQSLAVELSEKSRRFLIALDNGGRCSEEYFQLQLSFPEDHASIAEIRSSMLDLARLVSSLRGLTM